MTIDLTIHIPFLFIVYVQFPILYVIPYYFVCSLTSLSLPFLFPLYLSLSLTMIVGRRAKHITRHPCWMPLMVLVCDSSNSLHSALSYCRSFPFSLYTAASCKSCAMQQLCAIKSFFFRHPMSFLWMHLDCIFEIVEWNERRQK